MTPPLTWGGGVDDHELADAENTVGGEETADGQELMDADDVAIDLGVVGGHELPDAENTAGGKETADGQELMDADVDDSLDSITRELLGQRCAAGEGARAPIHVWRCCGVDLFAKV